MKNKSDKILKTLLLAITMFLVLGIHYNVNAAEATETEPIDISDYVMYFSSGNVEWTGEEITPAKILVREEWDMNSTTLTENVDYTVEYNTTDMTSIGAKYATVTGIGNYTGSKSIYFLIVPPNPSNLKIENINENSASFVWEGPECKVTYYNAYIYEFSENILNQVKGPIEIEDIKYTVKDLDAGVKYRISMNSYTIVDSNYCISKGGTYVDFITLPGRAKNIKITAEADNTSKISWEGTGNPTYEVYLYNNELSDYEIIGTTTEKYLTIDNEKISSDYQIKIISYIEMDGEKIYSEEAIYTKGIVPVAPEKLTISQAQNGFKIIWSKVDGVQGYKIYRSTSKSSGYTEIASVDNTQISYEDKGLTTGTTYYYKIRAYNEATGSTYYSPYTEIKSRIMVKMPTGVSVTSYDTSAKISWSKVGNASGYRIYRATSPNGIYKSVKFIKGNKTFSYTDKGLKKYTKYYYKVRAYYSKSGSNYYSNYSDAYTKAALAKVSPTVTYNSKGYNTLKWKKITGSKGYRIYRATSKDGKYTRIKTITSGSKISYNDKKIEIGIRYWYKVVAYRESLVGQGSNRISIATGSKAQQINKIKLKTTSLGIKELDASMADLIKRATSGKSMSNYNKVKAIYTYIEKILKHKDGYNCKHFSGTFCAALNYMGIEAYCVSGETTTGNGGWTAHTWVVYELNGTKYVFDPSIDRHIADSNSGKIQYQRFFKTESEVKKKYKKDGKTYAFIVDFSDGKKYKWYTFYN